MSLSVRPLDHTQAEELLAVQLRCRGPIAALCTALIADHIRTLVCAPHLRSAGADPRPVHTSRLFAALDRNARFPLPGWVDAGAANHRSIYEFVRDQLERCGDIVSLGDGYWIPGPARLIRASAAQAAVVVGGLPTAVLRRALKGQIYSIGPARYVVREPGAEATFPEETVSDWLGAAEPLASWTERTLAWAATQLVAQAEITDESIEIYAPDVYRVYRRQGTWLNASEFREPAPMLRLFRPKMATLWAFDRPDYLGIFNCLPGAAQLVRAVQIPREMAHRLRFGFDQRLATPRTIGVRRVNDAYSFDLKFGLPEPERKVLGLTWRDANQDSTQYLDDFALPALNDVAAMLGIRMLKS
ncbi:MAG: hypothetical protein ACFCUT_03660 [Kiloniellaceae bacterium]